MFKVIELFRQLKFVYGTLWLLSQQLCVGASVALLAIAATKVEEPKTAIVYFLAFAVFMIVPYGFGIMANLKYDQWYLMCIRKFSNTAVAKHPFKPRHYPLQDVGAEREAVFSNSAPAVLSEFCSYVMTLLSSALNAAITLLAVAFVVDWRIAIMAMISFAGCLILGRIFARITSEAAFDAEEARVGFVAQAASLWPNLAIGNKHAVDTWTRAFDFSFSRYWEKFNRSVKIQSWSQLAISAISLIPTTVVLVLLTMNASDQTDLAAVLVVAPRVFQILLSLNDLSVAVYDWSQVKERLEVLNEFFSEPKDELPLINESVLSAYEVTDIHNRKAISLNLRISKPDPGRIVLSGPNGSGKTTHLLTIKQRFGNSAWYLPSQSRIALDVNRSGSTGQQKRQEIDFLCTLADLPRLVLLDEWDANLDRESVQEVSKLIDCLATRALVIEVRHRSP